MSSNSSLRPAWRANSKGFQPPPQVKSERSASVGSSQDYNKFAALDEDDDDVIEKAANNSRSEALRSATSRSTSMSAAAAPGSSSSKPGGRSLADLAARERPRSHSFQEKSSSVPPSETKKVIRFTRERLLSMRPEPKHQEPPDYLKKEIGDGSVILSDEPQDPVCWDTFDAEEIWATAPQRRPSTKPPADEPRRSSVTGRRESSSSSAGRWQRGVALPPASDSASSKQQRKDADDPSDLWDDPGSAEAGAASDFSAFGTMPEEFDFEKMTEATRKIDEEIHGHSRSRTSSTASENNNNSSNHDEDDEDEVHHVTKIDASRPLAQAETMIRSGSGDDVNVFEDFDDPDAGSSEPVPIKAVNEDPTASSRLMAMIGVKKDEEPSDAAATAVVAAEAKESAWGETTSTPVDSNILAGIPLNPWGDPIVSSGATNERQRGLDLQAQLREAELAQQKAAAAAELRRQQEEAQQRARQQQERARQQQQQQQQGVQSQVELVLMERISNILENSWGRSDLVSILSTLHAEDSRVIPLLNNVDALRALLLRNPRRVVIRQDPALRAEMATLQITNAQWQQQQQQQAQQQRHQEELQRREQQRRMEEQRMAMAAAAAAQQQRIVPDAPWYYSDPQKNIQGPFRGDEMRQWLEAGYFKGDLPISQNPTGPFRPLSHIFSDLSVAFRHEQDNAEEEALLKAERAKAEAEVRERLRQKQLEQERQEKEAAERRRAKAEQEQRARAEAEAAAAAAKKSNGGNESSTQLKMMLGLGAQGAAAAESQQAEAPSQKANEKKTSKKNAQQRSNKVSPAPEETSAARNSAPAWGGAAASQPSSRKSMSEIQKEEARAAAVAAMNREGTRSSGSGWANVAASRGGSTAWPGGAAKQQPAAVLSNAGARPQPGRSMSLQPTSVAAANAKAAAQAQPQRSNSVSRSDAAADAFGAKMSPALEKWCKDQMNKLNGTDDLTLVAFCMTLNDPDEIRQYLTAYLGATPQVNNFATEFINRKGGTKDKQEEWESTVTAKKGRKKKTGAR